MEARPDLFGEGGPDLADRLAAWVDGARVDAAAAARAREGFLRLSAGESATFAGVLVDLAERGEPVLAVTVAGRRHRGALRAVGIDFVTLRTDERGDVLLAFAGIASVRTDAGPSSVGDRPVAVAAGLVDALALLAEDRPRLLVVPVVGEAIAGELRAVGRDVITLALDGSGLAYVAIANVGEVATA